MFIFDVWQYFDPPRFTEHCPYDMDTPFRKPYSPLTDQQVLAVLSLAPVATAIYSTDQFIIESANLEMLSLWAKDQRVIGLPLGAVLQEQQRKELFTRLRSVWSTGLAYTSAGEQHTLTFTPQKTSLGEVYCILHTAAPFSKAVFEEPVVTDTVTLTASSDALQAALAESGRLFRKYQELLIEHQRVRKNEDSLRNLVMNAHYGLLILRGRDWIVEVVNSVITNLWGKQVEEVLGLPLIEVLPDLYDQAFPTMMQQVYESGIGYGQEEEEYFRQTPEGRISSYISFYYDPIFDDNGIVTGIIASAEDITDKVQTRKLLEKSLEEQQCLVEELNVINEELADSNENLVSINFELVHARQELQNTLSLLKFTVEAAKIGTWSLDLATQVPTFSDRQKEMYGFYPDDNPGVDDLVKQVVEDRRAEAVAVMQDVISTGGLFDLIYCVKGYRDGINRWLRVLGSTVAGENGSAASFSGVSIETTVQMQDELRKNQFINIVSHELKTPLTSLKVYIQLLQQRAEEGGDNYLAGTLAKADAKLDKMTSIINGFLNISQLESGKIQLHITEFDLKDLIGEMADESNIQLKSKNIHLKPSEHTLLSADRDKIGQVITNLLSNASKYSPADTPIEIGCFLQEDKIVVSVQDQGIGIKAEDQSQIFDRYFRVDSNENNIISGFGIGLYLCHEILERHQGKLYVESTIDQGSTFYFSLPLRNEGLRA